MYPTLNFVFDFSAGVWAPSRGDAGVPYAGMLVYNTGTLQWERATAATFGGGASGGMTDAQFAAHLPLSVTGTFFQATQPMSAAALPLPAGASTSALQTTGNTSLGNLDVALSTRTKPADQQHTIVDSGSLTANAGTNLNTSALALEAGHLATIDTSVAKIPGQGQALAAASLPVVLTAIQIASITPPAAITGFATETTLAGRLKPADTLTGVTTVTTVTTVTAVTAITNALPAGTNRLGSVRPVDSADADLTAAKASQTARFLGTQDAKDSGRVAVAITSFQAAGIITTEALFAAAAFSRSADGAAASTGVQFTVTAGKRFRLQSLVVSVKNTAAAAGTGKLALRYLAAGGTILITSPAIAMLDLGSNNATAANYLGPFVVPIPDGFELLAAGTFGFTNLSSAVTMLYTITLLGYEY